MADTIVRVGESRTQVIISGAELLSPLVATAVAAAAEASAASGQITELTGAVKVRSGGSAKLLDKNRFVVKQISRTHETLVEANVHQTDAAIIRLLDRHGFKYGGISADFSLVGGTVLDRRGSALGAAAELAWAGALTDTSFEVAADVQSFGDGRTQLVVATDAEFADRVFISTPVFPDETARGTAGNFRSVRIAATGLRPDTTYYWRLDVDGIEGSAHSLRTAPEASVAADFTFAVGSCNEQSLFADFPSWGAIEAHAPLFFLHLGDLSYSDITTDDVRLPRAKNTRRIRRIPAVASLIQSVPIDYIFDNHDAADANLDLDAYPGTTFQQVVANSRQAYRETTPHYTLATAADGSALGLAHAFSIGNARFIVMDTVSFRDAGTAVIGAAQMQWVKDELLAAEAGGFGQAFLCSPENWGDQSMGWASTVGGAPAEQVELCDYIRDNLPPRFVTLITGDEHYCAIDDGTNTDQSTSGGLEMPQILSSGLAVTSGSVMPLHTFTWNGVASDFHDNQQAYALVTVHAAGGWTVSFYGEPYVGSAGTLLGTFSSADIL